MNRRQFLGSSALTAAGLALPLRTARASVSGSDLRFIFITNYGGWDPTRVFTPEFSNDSVDMEPEAEARTVGDMTHVSHFDRPSVDAFFDLHADQSLVLNGMQVRSIAHEICAMIALTGSTSGSNPDWATALAHAQQDRFTLPHLVMGGPSFTGPLGTAVAQAGTNSQLEMLLSGDILAISDTPVQGISRPAEGILDAYLERRSAARVLQSRSLGDAELAQAFDQSLQNARGLKDYQYVMNFSGGSTLAEQAQVAVQALSTGLSRCVSLTSPVVATAQGWDTHADNDEQQSPLWEGLFSGLLQLMDFLATTPGEATATLAEQTVVVVLSEMGRTAALNGTNGKDHWPYTSMLMVGPGLGTGRVVGALDDLYAGRNIDPGTGELDDNGVLLSVENVGATILQLGDVDPSEFLADASVMPGLLT